VEQARAKFAGDLARLRSPTNLARLKNDLWADVNPEAPLARSCVKMGRSSSDRSASRRRAEARCAQLVLQHF
jgi:hypothetical protein